MLLALTILVGITTPVSAQVPRVYGQGAAASGMGNAFAAQADNPSALHYNPAGMTQLRGIQLMGGLSLVGGATDFAVRPESPPPATMMAPLPGLVLVMATLLQISKTWGFPRLGT